MTIFSSFEPSHTFRPNVTPHSQKWLCYFAPVSRLISVTSSAL